MFEGTCGNKPQFVRVENEQIGQQIVGQTLPLSLPLLKYFLRTPICDPPYKVVVKLKNCSHLSEGGSRSKNIVSWDWIYFKFFILFFLFIFVPPRECKMKNLPPCLSKYMKLSTLITGLNKR